MRINFDETGKLALSVQLTLERSVVEKILPWIASMGRGGLCETPFSHPNGNKETIVRPLDPVLADRIREPLTNSEIDAVARAACISPTESVKTSTVMPLKKKRVSPVKKKTSKK